MGSKMARLMGGISDTIQQILSPNLSRSKGGARVGGVFSVECVGADGKVKWREESHNIVVTTGLQYILDAALAGGTAITSWYVGLIGSSPTLAAADTPASHSGWNESAAYSNSTRPAWTKTRAAQTMSNSASKASFSINGTATIYGAFIISDSAKSGTAGTLLCECAFASSRSVLSGDTLNVQYDFSAADDGV